MGNSHVKKRTSAEFNNDKLTLFQSQDNAKRANVDSKSDTTLHDLPMELLECILVKVVATEVKDLKLARSVWKEKADLVIGRLGTVCSQWSHILSASSFGTRLNRILDGTDEESILVEVLHEFPIMHPEICAVTTMNDEIFMLYKSRDPLNKNHAVHVYDRNNMTRVKAVIPLPGGDPVSIAGCNVSNCVYVGLQSKISLRLSILRISKDAEHQFSLLPWIKEHKHWIAAMSVSANGKLIIISVLDVWSPNLISIFDANGTLQEEVTFSANTDALRYKAVLQRSNGNLILVYISEQHSKTKLSEIDRSGRIVRQYQSLHVLETFVSHADIYGRIVMVEPFGVIKLLDSEFNLQGTYALQQDQGRNLFLCDVHYDSGRNEILRIHTDWNLAGTNTLTIFRFTEE